MFRRSHRRVHHRNTGQRGPFGFLRKPIVQLSILAIAAIAVIVIALTASK